MDQPWAPRWWAVFAWASLAFTRRDGMVLGAAVGFGFAALESSGYALASLFVVQGQHLYLSFSSVIVTELIRGVLAPFGHGLWSAILGGAIFHATRGGRLRMTWGVLVAFLGVSLLHSAFDTFGGILGYVVISIIGVLPLAYFWWRGDRGLGARRQQGPSPACVCDRSGTACAAVRTAPRVGSRKGRRHLC